MSGIVGSKLNIRGSGLVGSLGTDGQHLLSAGAGKTNVFETAAAAGLTLIKEVDASDVAAVTMVHGTSDVVFDTTYKVYLLTITNMFVSGDEALALAAMGSGSALRDAGSYWTGQFGSYGSPALPNAYADRYEDSFWASSGDVESDAPVSGWAYFYNVGVGSTFPQSCGQIFFKRSNGNPYGMGFAGWYETAISDFDGFSLQTLGGPNIASGNFKLYGLA